MRLLTFVRLVSRQRKSIVQIANNNFSTRKALNSPRLVMHSSIEDIALNGMQIKVLPALKDNYMYLIIDNATKEAAIVDPVATDLVIESAKNSNVTIKKVLTTHHHWDHAGGNEQFVKLVSGELSVYGGDDRIGGLTNKVGHDDIIKIGDLTVRCIFTPCHTSGHICYHVTSPTDENGAVFTGDTLFQGGCGRFFEGTADEMYESLITKLSALPDETLVFCGHEYTLQNLGFARHVEPDNQDILRRIEWAELRRAANNPTVPSTIAQEKSWNPFMRVKEEAVKKHTSQEHEIDTMKALRLEKDDFKG